MRVTLAIGRVLIVVFLAAGYAQAATILDVTSALALSDPTQLGRVSRTGIPSDWSTVKPYPGTLSPTITFHYHVYSVNAGITPFIQITVDSALANTFVVAYDTSYLPTAVLPNLGLDTNYLGDAGFSGNPVPNDPNFFQVKIPVNHNLLVVVSNVGTGNIGVGDPYHLIVEGFIDSEFTDPPSTPRVPEVPSAVLLTAGGVALALLKLKRLS